MGKGTKHKCDWKPTILQTAIDARRLYVHTVHIIHNPNVFKPERDYMEDTLKTIQKTALTIYMDVWKANRIKEGNSKRILRTMGNFVKSLKEKIYG